MKGKLALKTLLGTNPNTHPDTYFCPKYKLLKAHTDLNQPDGGTPTNPPPQKLSKIDNPGKLRWNCNNKQSST